MYVDYFRSKSISYPAVSLYLLKDDISVNFSYWGRKIESTKIPLLYSQFVVNIHLRRPSGRSVDDDTLPWSLLSTLFLSVVDRKELLSCCPKPKQLKIIDCHSMNSFAEEEIRFDMSILAFHPTPPPHHVDGFQYWDRDPIRHLPSSCSAAILCCSPSR